MLRNERVFAGLWPKIRKQPFCNGLVVASGKAAILAKAYVRRYDKPPFAPRQDLGQIMDGVPFLVFPFIAGPTNAGARGSPLSLLRQCRQLNCGTAMLEHPASAGGDG